ncbi:MAG TPA: TonB-dependent receptor [Pseudoxanthomonas sp.]|nr:TonB-dependent receptor [Pseudoxanthomonas sp.]
MNKRHPAPKRSRLSAALFTAMVLPLAGHAFAQETDSGTEAQNQQQTQSAGASTLDKVTVVGSRIKRAQVEGPAPVTVITRADIDREGFQTVADMLQTLTQNTTSSFTGDLGVTGFTPNAQVVNLRNMGPGYTLVLINGRRPAQYPQPYNRDNNVVNIKAIPTSIIERVEVLTGGASAIYGSDAVAGVVNIVLRENYEGQQLRGTVGTTEEGGGDSVNLEFTSGHMGDRWSLLYALQYSENEPVFASQRDYLADRRNNPYGLAVTPSLAHVAISGITGRNLVYDEATCDALGFTTATTAARGTFCGPFDFEASRSIWNKNRNYNGYVYGTFDFTDNIQGWGSLNFYTTDAKSSGGTEFWGTSGDRFTVGRNGAATTYFYDPNLGDYVQLQRLFTSDELGGEEAASTLYDEKSFDLAFGLRGTLADRFDWDFTASHGKYEYEADRPRLLAKAVHDYYLGPLQGYVGNYPVFALNLDRWNAPITPDIYRSFATRVKNVAESTSSQVAFNISGDLFELPAGPLGFAAVVEGVRQTTDLVSDYRTDQTRPADEHTIYNLTSSGETHGERDRYAAGVEFRVPIFESLTLQAAGRYDKYDDITAVDDAMTYNLGLEWRPFSNLLLRGSYATSFRAPDMQLVYAEGAASYATILDEYSCRSGTGLGQTAGTPGRTRSQCNQTGDITLYQAQSMIAGNPLLKEEEGTSWGYGFVWDIVDDMSLTVDYWRIKLEDASTALSSTYILENEANCRLGRRPDGSAFEHSQDSAFCQNIMSLVTRTQAPGTAFDQRIQTINTAYINSALTEVSGVDASYKYRYTTDRWGTFNVDLGYSLILTNKYQENEDDTLTDYRDLPLFDYSQRSRARGSIGWTRGDWNAAVFGTRYGSNWNYAWEERLPPYILYNLQVGKKFGPNLKVDLTVVNVTDNQFRHDPSNTAYPYFNGWIGADPLGRRYFLSASYRF